MSMKNHWLHLKGKKNTIQEINSLLEKFIGYNINPLDVLFIDMRNEIIKFFQKYHDKLKYFTDGTEPFDYNFDVDEKNGEVANVTFTVDA